MAEVLYATSHLAGSFSSPNNALGNTPSTWAGQLDSNTSVTSRWAIDDPVDALTPSATHAVAVLTRKGSNSGDPTVALNLYENGTLIRQIGSTTSVTSTTGQTISGTFTSSEVTNRSNVEVEVVMTAASGSPSVRNSAQVAYIEWTADTTASVPEDHQGGSSTAVLVSAAGSGSPGWSGGSTASASISVVGSGERHASGGSVSALAASTTGAGSKVTAGGQAANVSVTTAGSGVKATAGGSSTSLTVSATGAGSGGSEPTSHEGGASTAISVPSSGAGTKHTSDGSNTTTGVSCAAGGSKHSTGGSGASVLCQAHAAARAGRSGGSTVTVTVAVPTVAAAPPVPVRTTGREPARSHAAPRPKRTVHGSRPAHSHSARRPGVKGTA